MALSQGQYGGQLTPAVTANGGAAVLSNLGSAAMGMLSGGGSAAIEAAMKAAGDSSTTIQQPETNIGPQSTGNKVFNLAQTSDAFGYNDFWAQVTGTKGNSSMLPILAVVAIFGLVFYFLLRRK